MYIHVEVGQVWFTDTRLWRVRSVNENRGMAVLESSVRIRDVPPRLYQFVMAYATRHDHHSGDFLKVPMPEFFEKARLVPEEFVTDPCST